MALKYTTRKQISKRHINKTQAQVSSITHNISSISSIHASKEDVSLSSLYFSAYSVMDLKNNIWNLSPSSSSSPPSHLKYSPLFIPPLSLSQSMVI